MAEANRDPRAGGTGSEPRGFGVLVVAGSESERRATVDSLGKAWPFEHEMALDCASEVTSAILGVRSLLQQKILCLRRAFQDEFVRALSAWTQMHCFQDDPSPSLGPDYRTFIAVGSGEARSG